MPRINKSSYKTELPITTSQTDLLTLKIYFFQFFELLPRCEKNFTMDLELVTQDF